MIRRYGMAATLLLAVHPASLPAADAWLAYPDTGKIIACPLTRTGEAGAPSLAVRDGASGSTPALALGDDGLPAMAWLAKDGALIFSRFDGRRWSAPETVSPASGLHRGIPSLAVSRSATAVAWAEAGGGGFEDIFYAMRENGRWRGPYRAHGENAVPDILPEARVGSNGALGLSWQSLDGDRYVERGVGAAVPAPAAGALPQDLPHRLLEAGFPPEAVLAWRGEGGAPASARLGELLDAELRDAEEARGGLEAAGARRSASGRITIIAFGDSITYGRGSSTNGPATSYPAYLGGVLMYNYPGQPIQVLNEGNPGERTSSGLNRLDSVLSRYPADCILLLEGTNDIFSGVSFETIQENLKRMAFKALDHGVLPVLSTVIPTLPYGERAEQYQHTKSFYYGRYVQTMASRYNFHCADQWEAFVSVPDWDDVIMDHATGNHPNDDGYQYAMVPEWYETIKPLMDLILPFTSVPPQIGLGESALVAARGSFERITYTLVPSNDQVLNGVDCYAAVVTPQGSLLYFDSLWGLTGTPTPFLRKAVLSIAPPAGVLANLHVPSTAPLGSYTFYLLAVRALRDLGDSRQWASNLADIRFDVVR